MAVKAAVVGYEDFLKGGDLPETTDNTEESQEFGTTGVPDVEEKISDRELDEMDRKDLDSLLLNEMVEDEDIEEEGGICESIG